MKWRVALAKDISAQQIPFGTAWLSLLAPQRAEAPHFELCPTIRPTLLGETNLTSGLSAC